jgi:hypothetical protein
VRGPNPNGPEYVPLPDIFVEPWLESQEFRDTLSAEVAWNSRNAFYVPEAFPVKHDDEGHILEDLRCSTNFLERKP